MKKLFFIIFSFLYATASFTQVRRNVTYTPDRDSVIVAASERYTPASFLRKAFMGSNYRKEWATRVKMPVFDLKSSGLTIVELGGGQQTRSLELVDTSGREWRLRTVDKFVEPAVPPAFKNTLVEKAVQDLVSGAHPYAALPSAYLSEAAGIISPQPVLYFVPDSEDLGAYRNEMGNQVCFLEKRSPGGNWDDVRDTEEVLIDVKNKETIFFQEQVLKARLLDMLLADWDRHEDQWGWGVKDSAGYLTLNIISRDHDQAFYYAGGLVPKVAKLVAVHHINGFKEESRALKKLNYKSWGFDSFFLNDLDADEWKKIIKDFTHRITADVIDSAVKTLPPEIYSIGGKEISDKLKSRRDGLLENAMKYYEFLSSVVEIYGTDARETFRVQGSGGDLLVSVYSSNNKKIYERRFDPSETKMIVLHGLSGNDAFEVDATADSRIRIRMHGQKGRDEYKVQGLVRSRIFESGSEENSYLDTGTAKVIFE